MVEVLAVRTEAAVAAGVVRTIGTATAAAGTEAGAVTTVTATAMAAEEEAEGTAEEEVVMAEETLSSEW